MSLARLKSSSSEFHHPIIRLAGMGLRPGPTCDLWQTNFYSSLFLCSRSLLCLLFSSHLFFSLSTAAVIFFFLTTERTDVSLKMTQTIFLKFAKGCNAWRNPTSPANTPLITPSGSFLCKYYMQKVKIFFFCIWLQVIDTILKHYFSPQTLVERLNGSNHPQTCDKTLHCQYLPFHFDIAAAMRQVWDQVGLAGLQYALRRQ